MSQAGPSSSSRGNSKGKYQYRGGKKSRGGGPPRGGDGQGDFKGGPMDAYRTMPLPEMMSHPGISVTAVQGKEQLAEREIIDALEQAADELYPGTGEGGDRDDDDGDDDLEAMLKKELASMASTPGKKSNRFRVCKRETACVVYIICFEPLDPIRLVRHILERCERTAKCSFRFVQRLTPISASAPAHMDRLVEIAAGVLPVGFKTSDDVPLKFAIQVTSRHSSKLDRLDMVKAIAEEVGKLKPEHTVDLSNPDRTIMIEQYKNLVGLSILQDFEKYKKYNPARVAAQAAKDEAGCDAETEQSITTAATTTDTAPGTALPPMTKGQSKHANRDRRAASIAAAEKEKLQEKEKEAANDELRVKRKHEELEEGQVRKAEDIEVGEVVEDESAELGDEYEVVIAGGRATKIRRED